MLPPKVQITELFRYKNVGLWSQIRLRGSYYSVIARKSQLTVLSKLSYFVDEKNALLLELQHGILNTKLLHKRICKTQKQTCIPGEHL